MEHPEEQMTEGQRIAIEHDVLRGLLTLTAAEARERLEASRDEARVALAATLARFEAHAQLFSALQRRNQAHGGDPHERVDGLQDWTFEVVGPLRQRLAHVWQARPDAFDSLLKAVCAR